MRVRLTVPARTPACCAPPPLTDRFPPPNSQALGHNFCAGCLYVSCCPICAISSQRAAVAKKTGADNNAAIGCCLACCLPGLAILQNANQLGEAAAFTNWKARTAGPLQLPARGALAAPSVAAARTPARGASRSHATRDAQR